MSINPSELFDLRVPKGIAQNPDRVKEFPLILQFNITGEQGGTWTVDTLHEPAGCFKGGSEEAQCVITLSDENLIELLSAEPINRPGVVMRFILEGTLEVDGDVGQAMKLSRVFSVADAADLTR